MLDQIISMAIFSKKTWKRHTNPLSGWTRVLAFFLIPIPIWFQNWYSLIGLLAFFAINPILFPEPKSKSNWMSKSILGEELWTEKGVLQKDFPTLLNLLNGFFFFVLVFGAYNNLLEIAVFSTMLSSVFKLWYLDRMVFYYEKSR
jgi:hypothetical protein